VNEDDITVMAQKMGRIAKKHGIFIATAESCTGGGIAAAITRIPGSAKWFDRGFVTYTNDAKRDDLGVADGLLEQYGAVSEPVALAMAAGALARSAADVAVAITGVAGPDGGTPEKPVGLVHLHAVSPAGDRSAEFSLPGDRATVRARATVAALHLVRALVTQS